MVDCLKAEVGGRGRAGVGGAGYCVRHIHLRFCIVVTPDCSCDNLPPARPIPPQATGRSCGACWKISQMVLRGNTPARLCGSRKKSLTFTLPHLPPSLPPSPHPSIPSTSQSLPCNCNNCNCNCTATATVTAVLLSIGGDSLHADNAVGTRCTVHGDATPCTRHSPPRPGGSFNART